jgi:hypothetical protein
LPYFRFYGPTEAYFDKSWQLNDIELVAENVRTGSWSCRNSAMGFADGSAAIKGQVGAPHALMAAKARRATIDRCHRDLNSPTAHQ